MQLRVLCKNKLVKTKKQPDWTTELVTSDKKKRKSAKESQVTRCLNGEEKKEAAYTNDDICGRQNYPGTRGVQWVDKMDKNECRINIEGILRV